jgi:hypothetical protein
MCIGVISVYMRYNCVYYCDTYKSRMSTIIRTYIEGLEG